MVGWLWIEHHIYEDQGAGTLTLFQGNRQPAHMWGGDLVQWRSQGGGGHRNHAPPLAPKAPLLSEGTPVGTYWRRRRQQGCTESAGHFATLPYVASLCQDDSEQGRPHLAALT